MKNKVLIYARYLVALTVFVLCFLAFYGHFYRLKIFDIELVSALQSGMLSGFGLGMILFLAIIILTLVFGRIYCGALCPLGIFQEILMFLFKPFYRKRQNKVQKHYLFHYFLAAVLFGSFFGGTVVLLRFIEPYVLVAQALSGVCYGIGFMAVLAVLVFYKKRFFCTNICPVGALLGFISRFAVFKIRMDEDKCKICGVCAKSCPVGAIDFKNHGINNETCIKCFKCLSSCQHGALYYGAKKQEPVKFSPKRRELILCGLAAATFGAAFKGGMALAKMAGDKVKKVILPAGAKNPKDFANRCLNCNLCVANCPRKIIQKATADISFVHLDYGKKSYCGFNCHKCSEVCPSGAIKRISLKEKQRTKIAQAVVDTDKCFKCGLCVMECPKHIIVKERGEFPQIFFDKCIGCGKCATVCPAKAITIKPIDEQITLK